MAVPIKGVAAIRSAVSELEIRVSAEPRRTQGKAISIAANTTTVRQCRRTGRSSFRIAATGSRSSAAIVVRASTSIAGLTSSTATLISRYGTPQITHIAEKRSQPRVVIEPRIPQR